MAFGWILGRRRDASKKAVEGGAELQNQDQPVEDGSIGLADIRVSIEEGLVMAFGPLGDPLPPQHLKDACAKQPEAKLRLPDGRAVDHDRLIDVLEAQQKGPLAERPNDPWVQAMLSAEGGFEPAPPECLAGEDSEGKSILGGRLTLGIPGGEVITLCDAHPGSTRRGQPAKLMVDGEPVSVEKVLCQAGLDNQGDDASMKPSLAVTKPGDAIPVLLGNDVEARLETASAPWEGDAKVDLFLSCGRQVSIDDLAGLLKDSHPLAALLATDNSETSYPLLADLEPGFDLARATIVMVSDIPDGWSLSNGLQSEQGAWMLDPSDLSTTLVYLSGSHQDAAALTIKVISIVGHDGTLEEQIRKVAIPPVPNQETSEPEMPPAPSSPISLIFDVSDIGSTGSAKAFLVRGIPEKASLSVGTYDPSVKGWVLKPGELDQLAIRDLDRQTATIEVELAAIYLDQDGPSRVDVIAKKTIAPES